MPLRGAARLVEDGRKGPMRCRDVGFGRVLAAALAPAAGPAAARPPVMPGDTGDITCTTGITTVGGNCKVE